MDLNSVLGGEGEQPLEVPRWRRLAGRRSQFLEEVLQACRCVDLEHACGTGLREREAMRDIRWEESEAFSVSILAHLACGQLRQSDPWSFSVHRPPARKERLRAYVGLPTTRRAVGPRPKLDMS